MIDVLIDKTNTEEFYQNCNLILELYSFNAKTKIAEFVVSINQVSYDEFVEYEEWKITCKNTEKIKGFDFDLFIPYPKMRILKRHPLLWLYHGDELECEIKGTPNDIHKFIFELLKLLEKEAGNWINLNDIFISFTNYMFKLGKGVYIPASMEKGIQEICIDQNLTFKITSYEVSEDTSYADKPNTKVLMFGNEDVSPYFNLGQSYIIAGEFTAERIK